MTPYENVLRAVTFNKPERIPISLYGDFGSDVIFVFPASKHDLKLKPGEDDWGCIWEKVSDSDTSMGQVKYNPLTNYDMLSEFKFPDYSDIQGYEYIKPIIEKNEASGEDKKFIIGFLPMSLAHRTEYLRGSENAWTDPYLYPEEYKVLLNKIAQTGIDTIKCYEELGGIHAIMFVDDWGFQDRAMISTETFDEFLKPVYTKVFKEAHDAGMLTFMHSCGYIIDLHDSFVEAGSIRFIIVTL